jgi:serine/threonine protein kinase/tetratricopeptide (TPR) repeat protein
MPGFVLFLDDLYMIGQTISHYRILEKLGEGGMGVVYKAQDTTLDRNVALKFLPQYLTSDPVEKERFYHEAKAAASLTHANVAVIHEIGEHDGQVFIVMEFVEGKTLKTNLTNEPLSIMKILDLAIQVCEGLSAAHEKGIVHRDIKSDNIMVTPKAQAKITDFGLAKLKGATKLTKAGSTLGTAAYMSPEQAQGADVDHRSDIFSFGIVLYEMLTGRLPFRGEHEAAMMYSLINEQPEPIARFNEKVTPEIEHIVAKALEKDRDDRYQHADDLLSDLRRERKKMEYTKAGFVRTSTSIPAVEPVKPKSKMKYIVPASVVAVVVVLFVLFNPFNVQIENKKNAKGERKSIAVLPFTNMSSNKEDEYFSDGITEDIITQLAKIGDLKVIARTSMMHYKNTEKSILEIAKELNVSTVLEGSVRRAGNQVRIAAQLIDASSNEHLWAETYDKEMTQIFAIQSDVAQQIAGALKTTLSLKVKERIAKKPTENTEAYQLCLQGRFYWNKRTGEGTKKAADYFLLAIEKDPTYAQAYAGLALTYMLYPTYVGSPVSEYEPKAKDAARKALALDSTLAEPHAVLGKIKDDWENNLKGGEKEYQRAIELNPNFPTAHHWYFMNLNGQGRFDDAFTEILRAQELDPLSLIINVNMGGGYLIKGQYDKAFLQYKKTLELDPSFPGAHRNLGNLYQELGDYEKAKRSYDKAAVLNPNDVLLFVSLGQLYFYQGKYEQSIEELKKFLVTDPNNIGVLDFAGLIQLLRHNILQAKEYFLRMNQIDSTGANYELGYVSRTMGDSASAMKWYERGLAFDMKKYEAGDMTQDVRIGIAQYYALTGGKSTACDWLQKAIDKGWRDYRTASINPMLKNLHSDERFKAMMATIKARLDEQRKRIEEMEKK